ncbi:MAG: porin [Ignavibacteriaceae bacterium]
MEASKNILSIFILFVLCFPMLMYAQKKVEYGGYFEIGGKSKYKDIYTESFYRAKLEYKLKINDFTKIELDIRANSENHQIELYEASASFKFSPGVKLEVGNLKKRYGLEEQISHEKLTTINESMINDYLEPLGFVSRDPGVQLYWDDKEDKTTIIGGLHYNESHRFTILAQIKRKGLFGLKQVGAGFQLARERDNQLQHTYIASVDAAQDFGSFHSEFEIFTGQDPIESYYRRISGNNGMVNFFGVKTLLAKKFFINSKIFTCIEPLFLGSFLVKDVDEFDVNSFQLLFGCNIYLDEDIRLMINGDLMLTNHDYDKDERTMYGSNVAAQLQIRW